MQSSQLLEPRVRALPVRIQALELRQPGVSSSRLRVGMTRLVGREDRDMTVSILAVDGQGQMTAAIEGCRFRVMEERADYPTAAELASPDERDERVLQRELRGSAEAFGLTVPEVSLANMAALHQSSREERRKRELPVIEKVLRALLETRGERAADISVSWLNSGKPVVAAPADAGLGVSVAHDDRALLCCAGPDPQGCDLAPITSRSESDWLALLGPPGRELLPVLIAGGDRLDRAGTRIWAAREALRKATADTGLRIEVDRREGSAVLLRATTAAHSLHILTFPVQLTRGPDRIVALVVLKP